MTDAPLTAAEPSAPSAEDRAAPNARTGRFRKRPVIVAAAQWFQNGDHPDDGRETFTSVADGLSHRCEGRVVRYFRRPDVPGTAACPACGRPFHVHGWLDTLEGGHRVCPGDWIITGVQGERYPCKPDVFAATYEAVP